MTILLTTKLPESGFTSLEGHTLIFPEEKFTKEELIKHIASADVLLVPFDYPIDAEIINSAKQLKLITNFGVGYNNIDLEAATAKGIIVTNTPDPVIEPTAEHAFTLMLAISHRIAELDRKMREPNSTIKFGVMFNLGIAIYGKTLGIIGMGNIGKAVAKRAIGCGMKVIYYKRHRLSEQEEKELNVTYADVNTLLATADFVSLHTPYNADSHHIINEENLKIMKQGSVLINTARGACVDEKALIKALQTKHLYGAALDVYEFEPKVSPELYELDNVLLSPHIGTGTIDGRIEMCHCCCDNINAFINGKFEQMNRVN